MYEEFRKNNEKLPGDEDEIMNKPTITLHLFPFDTEDPKYALPFTDVPVIVVQESMSIDTLRKYIAQKLNMNENELTILYNNQEMILTNNMGTIKNLYGFNDEKIVFYYAKRPSKDDK